MTKRKRERERYQVNIGPKARGFIKKKLNSSFASKHLLLSI